MRTRIRTLEAQIDEKNIEAWQNVNGSYEKKSVRDYSSLSNPNSFQYIPLLAKASPTSTAKG